MLLLDSHGACAWQKGSTDRKTECLPHDSTGLSIWTLLFTGACLRYSQGNWKESYDWKGAPGFIWDH